MIMPFVQRMVFDVGKIRVEDVGFYVGAIESLFSFACCLSFIPAARLSDRIGRREVLTVTLFMEGVCAAAFGFSSSLWQMILFRATCGLFAGR
jgi:MFS family permease